MLLLTVVILALLALVNYWIGGKALLYPPVVFCGMFALDVFVIWAMGDFFYPLRTETLFILLAGALLFSLGSWIATLWPDQPRPPRRALPALSQHIMTGLTVVSVVNFFLWAWWLSRVAAAHGTSSVAFIAAARWALSDLLGHSPTLSVLGTTGEITSIAALIAFYEREGHTARAVIAATTPVLGGVLSGSKWGPLTFLVGLLCIDWVKTRRLRWKLVLSLALVFIMITATVELYVHIGTGSGSAEVAAPVAQHFALYAAGGIVGLDRLVREPGLVPPINQFKIFYLKILRRLGQHVQVPENVDFVAIGPNGRQINVYTIYWSYLELGYFGAVVCMVAIGLIITLVYKKALLGVPLAVVFYAVFFPTLTFAAFNDQFIIPYFQSFVFFVWWLVYSLPPRWPQFKGYLGRAVTTELPAES